MTTCASTLTVQPFLAWNGKAGILCIPPFQLVGKLVLLCTTASEWQPLTTFVPLGFLVHSILTTDTVVSFVYHLNRFPTLILLWQKWQLSSRVPFSSLWDILLVSRNVWFNLLPRLGFLGTFVILLSRLLFFLKTSALNLLLSENQS